MKRGTPALKGPKLLQKRVMKSNRDKIVRLNSHTPQIATESPEHLQKKLTPKMGVLKSFRTKWKWEPLGARKSAFFRIL